MNRRPIMAGNWKMNLSIADGVALASTIRDRCGRYRDIDVVLAPQAMMIWPIVKRLEGSSVQVAAQNCHWADKGAFTGELAPAQIKEAGCAYTIVGHSERRQLFGETDEAVGQKARSLHDHGVIPIICIGETLDQRESEQTINVVSQQLLTAISDLNDDEVAASVIAYEPVWAIGTGRTATPAQAQEVHRNIREIISRHHGESVAQRVRIQYGGSVKPNNVRDLMAEHDIDGALVGGASLTADSFVQIVAHREDID
ncbi:MAG: triose-phosphate isomerase [Myxococcota bacterium]|nr:triose-phosphate isomerase [Myxococcota bacterium]